MSFIRKLAGQMKAFRVDVLNMTQEQLANLYDINVKNISAFENGRSTNVYHVNMYAKACETDAQKAEFKAVMAEVFLNEVRHFDDADSFNMKYEG